MLCSRVHVHTLYVQCVLCREEQETTIPGESCLLLMREGNCPQCTSEVAVRRPEQLGADFSEVREEEFGPDKGYQEDVQETGRIWQAHMGLYASCMKKSERGEAGVGQLVGGEARHM